MSDIDNKVNIDIPDVIESPDLDIDFNEDIEDTSNEDTSTNTDEERLEAVDEELELEEYYYEEEEEDKPKKKRKRKSTLEEVPKIPNETPSTPDYGNAGFTKTHSEVEAAPSSYDYSHSKEDVQSVSIKDYQDQQIMSHIDMSIETQTQESIAHTDMSTPIQDSFIKENERIDSTPIGYKEPESKSQVSHNNEEQPSIDGHKSNSSPDAAIPNQHIEKGIHEETTYHRDTITSSNEEVPKTSTINSTHKDESQNITSSSEYKSHNSQIQENVQRPITNTPNVEKPKFENNTSSVEESSVHTTHKSDNVQPTIHKEEFPRNYTEKSPKEELHSSSSHRYENTSHVETHSPKGEPIQRVSEERRPQHSSYESTSSEHKSYSEPERVTTQKNHPTHSENRSQNSHREDNTSKPLTSPSQGAKPKIENITPYVDGNRSNSPIHREIIPGARVIASGRDFYTNAGTSIPRENVSQTKIPSPEKVSREVHIDKSESSTNRGPQKEAPIRGVTYRGNGELLQREVPIQRPQKEESNTTSSTSTKNTTSTNSNARFREMFTNGSLSSHLDPGVRNIPVVKTQGSHVESVREVVSNATREKITPSKETSMKSYKETLKNAASSAKPIDDAYIRKAPLREIMENHPEMVTSKYRQIMSDYGKNIQSNGVRLSMDGSKPIVNVPSGRVILNASNQSIGGKATIQVSLDPVKATSEYNKMRDKAMQATLGRNSGTITPTGEKRNAFLEDPKNPANKKPNDKYNERDIEGTKIKEEKIKAIKNQMKGEISGDLKNIGEKSYQVVIKQVKDESVDGKREFDRKTEIAKTLISMMGSKSIATMEINKLRNINNVGTYLSRNDIDISKLNGKDFASMVKKSNKHDYSPLEKNADKIKGLSKKQMALIERARNMSASKNIILSSMDNFSKQEKELLTKGNVFNYSSKAAVLQNNSMTLKILRQNNVLKKYNFDKASNKDLKRLLGNKHVTEHEKILIKNVIENRKALKAFNKLQSNTSRVINTLGSKVKDTLRDDDSVQSLENIINIKNKGKAIFNASQKVGKYGIIIGKGVGKGTYKVIYKAGDVTHINQGLKIVGNKVSQTKPVQTIKNVGATTKKVVTAPFKAIKGGFKKLEATKPVQIMKKAGNTTKAVVTAPSRGIKKTGNFISLQKSKVANRLANNKLVKVVSSPFKALGKFLNFGSAVKVAIMKWCMIAAGVYLLLFLILAMLFTFVIPMLATSVICEEDTKIQEWVAHIQTLQADYDEIILDKIEGHPDGKDVLGNTIDKYGMPETIGPDGTVSEATVGYIIKYVDANGNIISKSDNSKDILSFLAVYLQQDYDLGAGYFEGMIEELFAWTHPAMEYEETDIYFCDYGCDSIEYHCYDLEGVPVYNTYGTRVFNENGCDPYYTYCWGCECPGEHEGLHGLDCTLTCEDPHYYSCSGCECPGHLQKYCAGHTQRVCYGHRDIEVTVTIKFLQDLLDNNYYLHEDKSFIHPLYNNKLETVKNEFIDIGGWNDDNKEWVWNIYNQDWFDLYGISVSAYGLGVSTGLTQEEMESLLETLPADISDERANIIAYAYKCVGQIPYYWGGKTSNKGLENNNFGALTTPDKKGRNRIGLDCSGFVNFLFNTVLDTYVGWSTSDIDDYCYQIQKSALTPGDIAFKCAPGSSDNHVGVFVGYNEYGQMMWIHENGSDNNVSCNNVNYWTYFYRPSCYGD